MTGPTSLRRWLAIAVGVHALAFAWVARPRPAEPPVAVEPPMQLADSEIDVEAPALEPAAGAASTVATEAAAVRAAAAPGPAAAPTGSPAAIEPAPAASALPSTPGDEGSWSFSPSTAPSSSAALAGLGFGAAFGAGVRATVAESVRRERGDPLHSSAPVFTARDIELGLIPGSNLVGLTRERVRIGIAATTGHAVLEFHIDGSGVVASVQVVDASSDRADWDDVATRLVRDARGAPPARMPAGAHGVTLTLSVDSSERTVSGSAPTTSAITKALRAINDPIDTAIDGKTPVQRVVAVRVVGVQAF